MIYAKIDRPAGIVTFRQGQSAMNLMEDWSENIKTLLTKLDAVGHQVHRELVIHKAVASK
jgi:26S proteasome regulatory subunit N5